MPSNIKKEIVERIDFAIAKIKKQYLSDKESYPWLIGYSGGKDSSCTAQLTFKALIELQKEGYKLNRKIYIFSSDTMIENPLVKEIIEENIKLINKKSRELGLPIEALILRPAVDRTFWVNIIGRGYPTPNTMFRWCTDRLKIEPANAFVKKCIDKNGEVIMVLGVRDGESGTRDRVLRTHTIEGEMLMKHTTMVNAYIFAPIRHFNTVDVFTYLAAYDSPWESDNRKLFAFYEESGGGECPVFVSESDKTSSNACGNTRMGCWVCTVVSKDKSLSGFIATGYYDFLKPLLEYRNWLTSIRDDEDYRCHYRNNGSVYTKAISIKKDEKGKYLMIPKKGSREKIVIRLDEKGNPIENKEKSYVLINKNNLSNYLKENNLSFKSPELANLVLRDEITCNYERLGTGPFTDEAKKLIFEKLIEVEYNLNLRQKRHLELITDAEILEIKKLWSKTTMDISFIDEVLSKYNRKPVDIVLDAFEVTNKKYEKVLKLVLKKENLDYEIVKKLIVAERENLGKSDRSNIQNIIMSVFNADKDNY